MATPPADFDLDVEELRAVAAYAAACARPALPVFEQARPDDLRPRSAIEAAEAFADGGRRTRALRDGAWAAQRAARDAGPGAAGEAARAAVAAAGAGFLHPLARATQVWHLLGAAAHTARAVELVDGAVAGDREIERARSRAGPVVVDVLARYPAAPRGGDRVGEILRGLDAALRAVCTSARPGELPFGQESVHARPLPAEGGAEPRGGPMAARRRDVKPPVPEPGERETLVGFLDHLREAVARKAEDAPEPAVRTPGVPSGTSVLGLVHHLTAVESCYFLGARITDWAATMRPPHDRSREEVVAAYRSVVDRANTVIATYDDLAAPGPRRPGRSDAPTMRWLLVHMIEETGRHAGHADILREQIDGATGR